MTVYRTCRNCIHSSDCSIKDAVRRAISGLHVTSIKFRCDQRALPFRAGNPVIVRTVGADEMNGDGYEEPWEDEFPGHFLDELGSKALLYVRPGTLCVSDRDAGRTECSIGDGFQPLRNNNGFVKVPFARVRPDPRGRQIESCRECGERDPDCKSPFRECPFQTKET